MLGHILLAGHAQGLEKIYAFLALKFQLAKTFGEGSLGFVSSNVVPGYLVGVEVVDLF